MNFREFIKNNLFFRHDNIFLDKMKKIYFSKIIKKKQIFENF